MREILSAAGSLAFVALVAAGTLFWAWSSWGTPQPISFNHKKHADLGVECAGCHAGATEDARAGIPDARVCALCHDPGKTVPRTPEDLAEFLRERKDIPWRRIYSTPGHVLFSHKRHAGDGRLDCTACHGDVAATERALTRRLAPLSMSACVDCHKKEGVTTDCLACHR